PFSRDKFAVGLSGIFHSRICALARAGGKLGRMTPPPGASHAFVEHVGEVEVMLRAAGLPDLFAEAGRALAELMLGEDVAPPVEGPRATVSVSARDREALLVEWLNELIFQAETEKAVYTRFDVRFLTDRELRAEIQGLAEPTLKTAVKAAT